MTRQGAVVFAMLLAVTAPAAVAQTHGFGSIEIPLLDFVSVGTLENDETSVLTEETMRQVLKVLDSVDGTRRTNREWAADVKDGLAGVLDRGDGWPDVVRSHLGEPFVTTKPDGVGLGLYYVHSLSEAVGAELFLEDRVEGGAAARISLPAIPMEAEGPA